MNILTLLIFEEAFFFCQLDGLLRMYMKYSHAFWTKYFKRYRYTKISNFFKAFLLTYDGYYDRDSRLAFLSEHIGIIIYSVENRPNVLSDFDVVEVCFSLGHVMFSCFLFNFFLFLFILFFYILFWKGFASNFEFFSSIRPIRNMLGRRLKDFHAFVVFQITQNLRRSTVPGN